MEGSAESAIDANLSNGSGASSSNGTMQAALQRMAKADPELAARLIVHSLPAAAATMPSNLSWRLSVDGLGDWTVRGSGDGGPATVEPSNGDAGEDFAIETDSLGLARLAAGSSPLGLMLRRRLRLRGKRRKALKLRHLDPEAGPRKMAKFGVEVDPDLIYRSLPYAIDPEWTRGHRFTVAFEVLGDGGGRWVVEVDDGEVRVHAGSQNGAAAPDATVRLSFDTWMALLRGDLSPTKAMQNGLTRAEGALHPVTLFGRWADRADGVDGPELEREERQRVVQANRIGSWGSSSNGAAPRTIDPAQGGAAAKRDNLLSYEQLYALWEKRNWRSHELDFSIDREQWLATPTEAQRDTAWTMSSFYVGEERVAADLAPFVLAAPSGEAEAFLATQLVDETRHAVFFDRWASEVMALSADDMRSRLREAEETMIGPWHFLFDDSLRDVAQRLLKSPDDLELFVEGIVIYHMVTEGVLAMTGQRVILQYMEDHSLYPGFHKGFSLVEQDEHRHIAFGVRFLRDVCEERPEMREVILRTLTRLLPEAARVFIPPYEDPNTTEFVSYDNHSSQVFGFAYNALRRRMDVIGVEIPPAEELMPGPIDPRGLEAGPISQPVDIEPVVVSQTA
ncbi:MAG TPA: SCP2 sterol-binding domain-containing protein [Solirubrobacterales bacterium]